MARKYSPTTSRRAVAEAALTIIDDTGLDSLTIRNLAKAVGVQGPSLYHHFRDRDEVLEAVSRLALEEARLPVDADADWRAWLVRSNLAYIRALTAHPNIVPLIISRHPRGSRQVVADFLARSLGAEGVPSASVPALSDYIESFVLGLAIVNSSRVRDGGAGLGDLEAILVEFIDSLVARSKAPHASHARTKPNGPRTTPRNRAVARRAVDKASR